MTIQNQISKIQYLSDGIADTYHIPFYFFNNEIAVYFNDNSAKLIENKDYIISSQNKNGGEIKFLTTPPLNTSIIITRDIPLTQLTTFIEGENFPATDYEQSLDRIVMQLQMLSEILNRALTISHNSNISKENILSLINDISQNYDAIQKIPSLASAINTIYEEILTYLDKNIKYGPINVSSEDIVLDDENTPYPYHIDIPLQEAKSTHIPTVVFSLNDAISANFAPIAECYDGYVRIFLKTPIAYSIEIPTILLQ